MDPRRLLLYYLVMTLFLLALAAGAYTGLREVSAEADDIHRRLEWVLRVEPIHEDLLFLKEWPPEQRPGVLERFDPPLPEHLAALRTVSAGGPLENQGRNLADLVDLVVARPADDELLRDALPNARILRKQVLEEAQEALRTRADRPAAERARWILYGSVGAAFLGSLVFTVLFLRTLRERRMAMEHLRRAEVLAGLGTLAAGVAHEVNNPLGTIATCSESALRRLRAAPPESAKAAALLETIGSEAERCSRIVRDLMEFSRDGTPALGPVDLPGLVRETASLASLNPRMRSVPVEVGGDADFPLVMADAGRLKQALLNLLSNAAAVSPEGTRVEVRVRRHGEEAAVEVRDHGPGVPPEDRRRIFEPFRTSRAGGTGLGLTVVERVASTHGGSVEVEDAPGGGALFRLRIPLRPERA